MSEHYAHIIEHFEQQAPGVLDYACPTCGAGVSEGCVRRGGGSHAARVDRMIRQRHRHKRVGIARADAWADAVVTGSSIRAPHGPALAVLGYAVADGRSGWRAAVPDSAPQPPRPWGVPPPSAAPHTRPALGSGADTTAPLDGTTEGESR